MSDDRPLFVKLTLTALAIWTVLAGTIALLTGALEPLLGGTIGVLFVGALFIAGTYID